MLPAIVQDILTRQVLMQGFMNPEALSESLHSGKVTFYSRSKQRLWCKGESSGNYLEICELALDCDGDSLLILVQPCGPTCHTGSNSCYSVAPAATEPAELQQLGRDFAVDESLGVGWLGALERIVGQRCEATDKPAKSYVQNLMASGVQRMAQKVGEEGVEVALAAMALHAEPESRKWAGELAGEIGDLFFHAIVLLQAFGMNLQDVIAVLEGRHRESLKTAIRPDKNGPIQK
ncbi:MAG: bifunctional phosphoribosyl-AMP cyclohydrolase/phosphoribosyl-ATP diphosphatase HisIE [Spirochaetota bacterium]